jgi:hypothetical protein
MQATAGLRLLDGNSSELILEAVIMSFISYNVQYFYKLFENLMLDFISTS